MRVLTEANLRTEKISQADQEYHVPEGTFVTPSAKEYLRDRNVSLIFDSGSQTAHAAMTRTPIRKQGDRTYIDASTGEGYEEKPEEMTHLRGNLLVPKTHPRIALRGRLDGLQAQVLLMQAKYLKQTELCRDLDSILDCLRAILGAEVKEEPLGEIRLFGLGDREIRKMSHNVQEYFGMEHPIPDRTMGELALELNLLRTQVRKAELCAANAFPKGDSLDIIRYLNRLSSGIYILFCRAVSGRIKAEEEKYSRNEAPKQGAGQNGSNR